MPQGSIGRRRGYCQAARAAAASSRPRQLLTLGNVKVQKLATKRRAKAYVAKNYASPIE